MDIFTKEKRSKIMRAIKSKNTKEEVRLAKALWHRGHRYRKNDRTVFGTPDLSFKKYKIAIFVDGEFFHGKDWNKVKVRLDTNKDYWIKKIERNQERDIEVNQYLASKGWTVLRFWSKDVKQKCYTTVRTIEKEIEIACKKINYLQKDICR